MVSDYTGPPVHNKDTPCLIGVVRRKKKDPCMKVRRKHQSNLDELIKTDHPTPGLKACDEDAGHSKESE